MAHDVSVSNYGSLVGLTISTPAAREWTDEHLPEDAQWMGNTVYVEPRYVDHIIAGMRGDGLHVV